MKQEKSLDQQEQIALLKSELASLKTQSETLRLKAQESGSEKALWKQRYLMLKEQVVKKFSCTITEKHNKVSVE